MNLPRFSIAKLMVIVGVAAFNIAAVRDLHNWCRPLFFGIAMIGLAVQVGLFGLIRGPDRVRKFWVGFVAFGSLAMLSFVPGTLSPPTGGRSVNGRMIDFADPGSPFWALWHDDIGLAIEGVQHLPGADVILGRGGEMPAATSAIMTFLPQGFIAAVGGLLTCLLFGRCGRSPALDPTIE